MISNNDKQLVEELTAIIKEFGKPARVYHSVRENGVEKQDEDDKFLKEFLSLLGGESKVDHKDKQPEAPKTEEAPKKEEAEEEGVVEDDFETFVGGLVVDAVEVEDDGERMYFCSVDDDAFYMPKAVFEKYFVKI